MRMKLVPAAEGIWNLIDENAPAEACVIAVIRGPVEAMALKRLCETRIEGALPAPFRFNLADRTYVVTPYADRSHRLSLRIEGDDGSLSRVETEFSADADLDA